MLTTPCWQIEGNTVVGIKSVPFDGHFLVPSVLIVLRRLYHLRHEASESCKGGGRHLIGRIHLYLQGQSRQR